MKRIILDRRKKVIGVAVLVLVLFLALFGAYKLGSRGQDERIANLASRLDSETKKAAGWWKIATAGDQKLADALGAVEKKNEELSESEKEFAEQTAALEACETKMAQLSKPPEKAKQGAKQIATKKAAPAKAIAEAATLPVAPSATPTVTPAVLVPAPAPAPIPVMAISAPVELYTLRLNVVEWSEPLKGGPLSRSVGVAIREGMAKGSVKRTSAPVSFRVMWRGARLAGQTIIVNDRQMALPSNFTDGSAIELETKDGQATVSLDKSLVGPATQVFVFTKTPLSSPPNGLPLVTTPGELERQIQNGVHETYLHFILAPAATPPPA